LTGVIAGLQNELREREIVVAELHHNYDKLLIKYAEAENKIDHLRFKVSDSSVKQASQGRLSCSWFREEGIKGHE
jgi:hypothetical protein